jgi:hypothetical protein
MKLDTNRIIGFYAPQNYGKTYLMSRLVGQIAKHVPVFVFDTNFERLTAYPQNQKNINFVKAKNIVNQEKPSFLNTTITYLRSRYSNFYLVIEDIDKLVDTSHKTQETLEIFKLASDSRHQRIGIIYATKEPTNIPVKLRSSTNLFFIGQFIEPTHVKTLSGLVDKTLLKSLKKPEFLMLDRYTNEVKKVMFDANKLVEL